MLHRDGCYRHMRAMTTVMNKLVCHLHTSMPHACHTQATATCKGATALTPLLHDDHSRKLLRHPAPLSAVQDCDHLFFGVSQLTLETFVTSRPPEFRTIFQPSEVGTLHSTKRHLGPGAHAVQHPALLILKQVSRNDNDLRI